MSRVNVDRRVLIALLVGASLLFVTEAPTSPYQQPWEWGSQDALDGARREAADQIGDQASVAASPTVSALVAQRASLAELPPNPIDFTVFRVDQLAGSSEAIILDTTPLDLQTSEPQWTTSQIDLFVSRLEDRGFAIAFQAEGIYLFQRPDGDEP